MSVEQADKRTRTFLKIISVLFVGSVVVRACTSNENEIATVPDQAPPAVEQPYSSPSPEPEQPTTDYAALPIEYHQRYIAEVNRNLFKFNIPASTFSYGEKVNAGRRLCQEFDSGKTFEQFIAERFDPSQMTEAEKSGLVIYGGSIADAATKVYCPKHAAKVNK